MKIPHGSKIIKNQKSINQSLYFHPSPIGRSISFETKEQIQSKPMKKHLNLLVRLFAGVALLLAFLSDQLEAFQPKPSSSSTTTRPRIDSLQSSSPFALLAGAPSFNDEDDIYNTPSPLKSPYLQPSDKITIDRRTLLQQWTTFAVVGSLTAVATVTTVPEAAHAAPPIAIIAEELGYFPVQNKNGKTEYVPKRVQRESSDQAVRLAAKLTDVGVIMYGSFWCPHCSRQKEMFGRKAWGMVNYVECASQGYGAKPALCVAAKIDGYPTWVLADGTQVSRVRVQHAWWTRVGSLQINRHAHKSNTR
jgi:hypothetical protein